MQKIGGGGRGGGKICYDKAKSDGIFCLQYAKPEVRGTSKVGINRERERERVKKPANKEIDRQSQHFPTSFIV